MNETLKEKQTSRCYIKARYVVALMAALGSTNLYSLRNSLNIAIISMVGVNNSSPGRMAPNYTGEQPCGNVVYNTTTHSDARQVLEGDFDWSLAQQGILLSCYYYGYTLSNVPGAWFARVFGIRLTFGITSLLASILTLLIPITAHVSFILLVVLRVTIGLLQGVTLPLIVYTTGIWAPPLERSRLLAISFAGVSSGNVIVFPIAGLITSSLGWEAVFYITGAVGCAWSLGWYFLIRDSPEDHPTISQEEREYITVSISGENAKTEAQEPMPWRKILTSKPYWAVVCNHVTENWATFITVAWVPTYIVRVLHFNIKSAGILSSLPYGLNVLLLLVGGFAADFMLVRKWLSRTKLRKLFSFIAQIIPILSLIMLPSFGCDVWMSVALLCTYYMFFALNYPGYRSSMVDMAPKYGGIMYSFSNTLACCISLAAPQMVGVILGDGALSNWRAVFYSTAAVTAFGLAVYLIFGTSDEQTWSRSTNAENSSSNETEKIKVIEESENKLENQILI